jgi:hypothetical protein
MKENSQKREEPKPGEVIRGKNGKRFKVMKDGKLRRVIGAGQKPGTIITSRDGKTHYRVGIRGNWVRISAEEASQG